MNRIIKFRGKRVDNCEWIIGNLCVMQDGVFILEQEYNGFIDEPEYHSQGMGCGLEDRNIRDRYEAMQHGWGKAVERQRELMPPMYQVIPESVGQFTGLTDRKGVEIWEGDILHCHEYDSSDCAHQIVQTFKNAVVGFLMGSFYYFPNGNMQQPHQLLMHAYKPTVIGNIHEVK